MTRRRGTRGRMATLLATAALPTVAACGNDEPGGTTVSPPPDSATSFLDDPCARQGGERRKFFHVTENGFSPKRVVVGSGAPVTFVNCGKGPHTITQVGGRGEDFDSGTLQPRERFDKTFVSIGTHRIADPHNPGAEMIIEVEGYPGEPQS